MLSITPNRDIVIGCHFPAQQPPEWMDEAWPMPLSILIPGHNTNAALNIYYNASAQTPRVSLHRSDTRNWTEMIWCTIALCKGATLLPPTDMKLVFLFRFLVIKGFIILLSTTEIRPNMTPQQDLGVVSCESCLELLFYWGNILSK